MQNRILSCRQARQKDLVEYLASLGHHPRKIIGEEYWYRSPLREEKTPSFKVNKKKNAWFDHGIGKGGNLIDFGIQFHRCTVSEFLKKISGISSFHQQSFLPDGEQRNPGIDQKDNELIKDPESEKSKIKILAEKGIESPSLIRYLEARGIPLYLAKIYCKEVDFELYRKVITALGFPNRSGGYELRNSNFKGSSSPKDISLIDHGEAEVVVFEGFFSFLSYQGLQGCPMEDQKNILVLNSLAFFEKATPIMERHDYIHLYLDHDPAGRLHTQRALEWGKKYIDRSGFYEKHKDLNDYLKEKIGQRQAAHRARRHR